jgi:Protein of unknown function (DUF2809)
MRARLSYVAVAVTTIAIGLWVHRGGLAMSAGARDVTGDALWAAMMVWWVGAAIPTVPVLTRGAIALAICFAVELSQLVHAPWLDAARGSTLGRLVLGSGFDRRDLLAYALGVLLAVVLERALRRWLWKPGLDG